MGAANCCKKPDEIVVEEIKNNPEGEKVNALDQDSYPQDTEYVFNANVYPHDDQAQQEVSNQKLYEQEGSPKIGGAYEVAINASSPVQYRQEEIQTPEKENQNQQVQSEAQNLDNQYSPEELAMYQNQLNINASPESPKQEIQGFNQQNEIQIENQEHLENQNQKEAQISIKQSNEPYEHEIKQSGISNQGPVDITTLASQQSAAPINTLSQVVKTQQQIVQTPATNSNALNIQQIPQINSQIQVKEAEEGEDLNKYFQIPTNLSKAKTTNPANVQMNEIQMQNIIGQNQSQKEEGNVASVLPITDNDDINKYFKQLTQVPPSNNLTDEEILNKYFSKTTSQEVKPEEIIHNNLNIQNIVDMKDLPPTFGSNDINNFKQTTTTTTTKTTGNVDLRNLPTALTSSEVNKIVDMKDLPATFGSNDINNFKQTTTTTTTKTTGNVDLRNLPTALTSSEVNKIVDMKDLPATFGSNDINNFQQTTRTTTTKTTGNVDLRNLPTALTSSEVNKIVDMKDLPATFGSNDINNFKQTTTTTTTKTTANIPGHLTESEIKKIIDMKDLPETFGSSNINNAKKTTVTTTTTTTPANNDINNFKQTTTTTTTKTTANIPGHLTESEIKKIIDMKDLPETFGSSNISNAKKTTVTTTTTTKSANIDLKQFGLEPNPSMGQFTSEPLDLKQFGLEPNASQISTTGQNKQVTTVTKKAQKNVTNPTEDYSKYFQNIQTSSTTPVDLHQFGLEKNASNISNILQGSNITFRQPGQSVVSSSNYAINDPLSKTSVSKPVITNADDYSKYFKTTKTTTTSLNQTGIPYTTNINLNNYGINIPQGKTTTTTTTTKTTGIPITSSAVTQNYTLPANYAANKVTTTKVTKTYVGPTQTSSYNYSYNIPATTTTTTTVRK